MEMEKESSRMAAALMEGGGRESWDLIRPEQPDGEHYPHRTSFLLWRYSRTPAWCSWHPVALLSKA